MKKLNYFYAMTTLSLGFTHTVFAEDLGGIQEEIGTLRHKIQQLEQQLVKPKITDSTPAISSSLQDLRKGLQLSGGLELNYVYDDANEASQSKGGDSGFSLFHIDLDAQRGDLSFSAAYWWYSYMDVIHHAWMGYDFSDTTQLQLGVTKVPFGILPFSSNSWWFGSEFYVGFEDNYDFGLKLIYDDSPLNLQLAFFKNTEFKSASKIERYAYDIVTDEEQANEKTNQFNARVTYTLKHDENSYTEFGLSGQYGQLYNNVTDEMGDHWAGAVHLVGQYAGLNVKLQALQYEYDPKNPPGMSNKAVLMGGLADAYLAVAKGSVMTANIGYEIPVNKGILDSLYFYNDYSVLLKDEEGFEDSPMNVTGLLISTGDISTFVEFIMAKNTPYVGVPSPNAFMLGDANAEWGKVFNITMAYKF